MRFAMAADSSVLPLSATIISPTMPFLRIARCALLTQPAIVSASFRQGITTLSSMRSCAVSVLNFFNRICLQSHLARETALFPVGYGRIRPASSKGAISPHSQRSPERLATTCASPISQCAQPLVAECLPPGLIQCRGVCATCIEQFVDWVGFRHCHVALSYDRLHERFDRDRDLLTRDTSPPNEKRHR